MQPVFSPNAASLVTEYLSALRRKLALGALRRESVELHQVNGGQLLLEEQLALLIAVSRLRFEYLPPQVSGGALHCRGELLQDTQSDAEAFPCIAHLSLKLPAGSGLKAYLEKLNNTTPILFLTCFSGSGIMSL